MILKYHPQFRDDLQNAASYYESQQAGLGPQLINFVEEECQAISTNPSLWGYVHEPIRRKVLKRFPFAIHYEQVSEDTVFVYGLFHGAMSPTRWHHRYDA